jgi:hypothetical protein
MVITQAPAAPLSYWAAYTGFWYSVQWMRSNFCSIVWSQSSGEYWRMSISEIDIGGLISVITTTIPLRFVSIVLSHFPQQSGILSSGVDKSNNGLCHSWRYLWWIRRHTPTLGGSNAIISMSTSRHLFMTSQTLFTNFIELEKLLQAHTT